jgi:DNA-directed RNA polymerase subunit M/transcription elongation factor TFIIS
MYYIGVNSDDPNKINYYCRNCKHVDNTISDEGVCVLNTDFKKTEQKFNHIINKYTKQDPTLPRIYNINCPNPECLTNKHIGGGGEDPKAPAEIIYIRYDDNNLKYVYLCVTCDTVWKTNEQT